MTEKLKCCPCCGGIPAIYGLANEANQETWHIRRGKQLEAENFPEEYATRDEAHKAWNRRVSSGESKNNR